MIIIQLHVSMMLKFLQFDDVKQECSIFISFLIFVDQNRSIVSVSQQGKMYNEIFSITVGYEFVLHNNLTFFFFFLLKQILSF